MKKLTEISKFSFDSTIYIFYNKIKKCGFTFLTSDWYADLYHKKGGLTWDFLTDY